MLATLLGSEKRATLQVLGHPQSGIIGWMLGQPNTDAGIAVTEDTALNYSAVWAALRVISETVAGLPCFAYEKEGDGKRRAEASPLYRIVHDEPNEEFHASDPCESTGEAYGQKTEQYHTND